MIMIMIIVNDVTCT